MLSLGNNLSVFLSCTTGPENTHSHPWITKRALNAQLQELTNLAIASSTRTTYKTGVRKFFSFCQQHGVKPLPADKETVVYFAVALSRSMAPSSIQVYLAAIGALHRQFGHRQPTHHNPRLNLVLRGAKRAHAMTRKKTRQPITPPILARLLAQVKTSKSLGRHDKRMLTAAFLAAFSGFLRVSECTAPSQAAFNPRIHPTRSDIVVGDGDLIFHIKRSKTDQLHQGENVQIVGTGGRLCPVRAMGKYLRSTAHYRSKAPLITFQNHKPLTRHSCLQHMRKLLQKAGYMLGEYNTHSFLIGAATHAAHVGMSSSHIKLLGRWRSSVYQLYTRSGATTLKQAATRLASSLTKYC